MDINRQLAETEAVIAIPRESAPKLTADIDNLRRGSAFFDRAIRHNQPFPPSLMVLLMVAVKFNR